MTIQSTQTADAIDERPATITPLGEIVAAHIRLERCLAALTRDERASLATMICDIRIAAE